MAVRFRVLWVAAACAALFDAQALSIGPSRGEAVVGQPLSLTFDLALDPGADAVSACVGAELFFGDTKVDPSRVRVSTRTGPSANQAVVQLVTSAVVNEPVVSVVLRAGCSPAVSRRFVLLSSSPVETVAPAANAARPLPLTPGTSSWAGSVGSTGPQASSGVVTAPPSTPRTSPRREASAPTRSASGEAGVARPAPARRAAPAPTAESPRVADTARSRPRLELQSPGDWLQEQTLPLRTSDAMATPALTTTPEQRAAAAALWRSLNSGAAAGAGDGVPASDVEAQQRVQALESQIKTLQTGVRLARGRETDLQSQLANAQNERDTLGFVLWPLAALAVVASIATGVLLQRRRRGTGQRGAGKGVWWKPRRQADFGAETAHDFPEGFVDTQPAPMDFLYPPDDAGPATTPPAAAATASPAFPAAVARATAAEPVPAARRADPDFAATRAPVEEAPVAPTSAEAAMRAARGLRNGSANDLADVQQNADFFASLGQYEQAIELLQEYIASHPGTSPVAYLDLLKLFHTLSATDPYRKLRTDFNAVFNAEVPPFASFLKPSRDLEAYTDVLQRIAEAWTQVHVLDLIESLLLRHSGEGVHPPFQLEAYRDLLLLYEIAKVTHGSGGGAPLTPPPSGMSGPTSMPAVAATAAVAVAPVVASAPPPSYLGDNMLDLAIEPPPSFQLGGSGAVADLGVPLDFASGMASSPAPSVSLDDITIPDLELPLSAPGAASSSSDPHLIDFDMFDVAMPPADKPPKT